MNKKISLGLTAAIALSAVAVSVIASVFITLFFYNRVVSDISDKASMYSALANVDTVVREHYYYADDSKKMSDALVSGYIGALGDGNKYMTAEEYAEYKNDKASAGADSVSYEKKDSLGYIRITSLYEGAVSPFEEALKKAEGDSVAGIVIDLRGVSQGDTDTAVKLADMIVPLGSDNAQAIAYAKDKNGETVKSWSADSADVSLGCVIFIDAETSGAAEVMTAIVSGYSKCVTIGAKTAGNGMYNEIFELGDGSALLLSTAEVIPYGGKSFNGVGISPDTQFTGSDDQFMQMAKQEFAN